MSFRRSLLVLASLTVVIGAAVPAVSGAQGGPCSPSTPQYCPPPKVKTGPAKHITAVSATLTGTVNPNGSATTCFFRYGKTKSYGSTTPAQNVGSGTQTVQVSAKVTGLTPKTTYHYQLVCSNLGGQATGKDKKFKTHGLPKKPAHVTTERGHHTSTTATFNGTVNPDGSATTCYFRWGRTMGYGARTRTKNVGSGTKTRTVSAVVTGLAPKTVYHFRLFCTNIAGTRHGRDRRTETLNQIRFRGHRTLTVNRRGGFVVRLHCNGNHQCVGWLTLTRRGGKSLAGRVRYIVPSHRTAGVRMRLTPSALKALTTNHHLSGRFHARDLDGSSRSRRVRLRHG